MQILCKYVDSGQRRIGIGKVDNENWNLQYSSLGSNLMATIMTTVILTDFEDTLQEFELIKDIFLN